MAQNIGRDKNRHCASGRISRVSPTRLTTQWTHLLRKSVYSACRIRPERIMIVWKHCRSMAHSLQSVAAVTHRTYVINTPLYITHHILVQSTYHDSSQSNTHPWWWLSACSCTELPAHQTPCQVPGCWGTCSHATPQHGPLQQYAAHYSTWCWCEIQVACSSYCAKHTNVMARQFIWFSLCTIHLIVCIIRMWQYIYRVVLLGSKLFY